MKSSLEFKNQIEYLMSLQELYIKVYYLESEKEDIQNKLDLKLKEIDLISKNISKITTESNLLKMKEKDLNFEILKSNDLLASIDEKEKSVKTQKEYVSIKNERILIQKKLNDNQLDLKNTLESLLSNEENFENLKDQKAKYQKEYKLKAGEFEKRINDLDKEIEDLKMSKKDLIDNVDQYLLNRFEFISKYKNGVAISHIIDGICESCNIKVAAMTIFEVMKNNSFVFCSSCSRILYLPIKGKK